MNRLNHQFAWVILVCTLACLPSHVTAQEKPNIVIVFMDNFGLGGTRVQRWRDHSRRGNTSYG